MQLHIVTAADGCAKLVNNGLVIVIVTLKFPLVLPEFQDFGNIGHYGQLGTALVKKVHHPARGFDHQLMRTAFSIAVDFVVQRENDFKHDRRDLAPAWYDRLKNRYNPLRRPAVPERGNLAKFNLAG